MFQVLEGLKPLFQRKRFGDQLANFTDSRRSKSRAGAKTPQREPSKVISSTTSLVASNARSAMKGRLHHHRPARLDQSQGLTDAAGEPVHPRLQESCRGKLLVAFA